VYTCFRGNTVNNTNRSFQEFANNPLAVTHPVRRRRAHFTGRDAELAISRLSGGHVPLWELCLEY
jgi:hypothetical protein